MSDSFSLIPLPLVNRRYAQALFDLVQEAGCVEEVEKALTSLQAFLDQNKDLKRFVQSPFFSAKEQIKVMYSVCDGIGFSDEGAGRIISNFLRVVAMNRRLSALPSILHAFQQHISAFRGEVSAQVISARPLDANQKEELCAALESVVGGKVSLRISVDPTILGGLIVRFGSRQIDTSLVTKLFSLKLALKKEVS
ncbi:F0F1 ATP synthase subunit delta [Bartonella sp. F02]|uniref:F0F1 ATP synthase subunit delta n=1 Tax=Bartonella sp. F02 TaxID=2967262 RepID=UPI0022A9AF28|nr:F0F1 ATP synthase subunit delta [Bartonella sp. F02]MCZ2328792.1 F0F1 ATP synthase subunit delta [Bartonella sp. F02]